MECSRCHARTEPTSPSASLDPERWPILGARYPYVGLAWQRRREGQFHYQVVVDLRRWCQAGLMLTLNGPGNEGGVGVYLALPCFDLWLGFDGHGEWLTQRLALGAEVETGVRMYRIDQRLVVRYDLAVDDSASSFGRRRSAGWRSGYLQPGERLANMLLGRVVHSEVEHARVGAVIPMPEGGYPATVALSRAQWKRPRWFAKVIYRTETEVLDPLRCVPVPGKGENSYDCGDDGIYSSTRPSTGPDSEWVAAAVADFAGSAMRSRERYGSGQAWVPDAGWPAGLVSTAAGQAPE